MRRTTTDTYETEPARGDRHDPDGFVMQVDVPEGATDQEKYQLLAGLVERGRPPSGPVLQAPKMPAGSIPTGIFDPDQLYQALPYRTAEYHMPGGGKVYVHPLSIEQRIYLNNQLIEELRKAGYAKQPESPSEALVLAAKERAERLIRGQCWQVILCCRQGPEPESKEVFQARHLDALRRNPGWAEAVEEIAKLSDSLSAGESESELLKRMMTDFFDRMLPWLGTCAGQLRQVEPTFSLEESGSDPALRLGAVADALEDFACSGSAASQQNAPLNRLMQVLAMGMGLCLPDRLLDEESED